MSQDFGCPCEPSFWCTPWCALTPLFVICTEAPALEEPLRQSGSGREAKMLQNPAFDDNVSSKQARHAPTSALSALQIHVRPKRSSFTVLSSARKDVQNSVFVSAKKTAGLTIGMVSYVWPGAPMSADRI